MTRRGHNEGSITHRKDGRWEAKITAGINPDGSPKRVSFYGKTRKEAAEKMNAALTQLHGGSFIGPDKMTFGAWLDYWLENCIKPPIRDPATWELHEGNVRNHLKPAVGLTLLAKLQTADLQRLYNALAKTRAIRTVHLVRQTAKLALKRALKEGKIHRNPNDATELEPCRYREIIPLTYEQAMAFMAAARTSPWYVAYLLVLETGLRRGEVLALMWDNIDMEECTVFVAQILKRSKNPDGPKKTALLIKRPKTEKSKGKVPFPEWLADYLTAYRATQEAQKAKAGEKYHDQGLVFATTKGTPIEPRRFLAEYHRLLAVAGIPRTSLHNLRHSFATILYDDGEDLHVIQELLRHTRIQTTANIYAAVTEKRKKKAASRIGEILRPPEGP